MAISKSFLIENASKLGVLFYQPFPYSEGVCIGSRFLADKKEYVVARIDNVICGDNELLVEGRAIKKELFANENV